VVTRPRGGPSDENVKRKKETLRMPCQKVVTNHFEVFEDMGVCDLVVGCRAAGQKRTYWGKEERSLLYGMDVTDHTSSARQEGGEG